MGSGGGFGSFEHEGFINPTGSLKCSLQGVAEAVPKPEHEMGPALSPQLQEKQQKGQSCTLSPAQRQHKPQQNLKAVWARGSQKINPYLPLQSRQTLLAPLERKRKCGMGEQLCKVSRKLKHRHSSADHGLGQLSLPWLTLPAGFTRTHQNPPEFTRIQQNPSEFTRIHQNPPEPTRTQLLWKRSESHIFHSEQI